MDFCPDANPASRHAASLAALGVLSHEPRLRLRNAVRATWLPDLPSTIVAKFVIRGLALQEPNATRAEASRHGDVLFVRARSVMLRENGPLQSLVLWFECAMQRFVSASFIGKADDDVWIRPSGWAALLNTIRGRLPEAAHAYVGCMEAYHWRLDANAPIGWRHFPIHTRCQRQAGLVGPFVFGKGASFFLTAHTAARVAGHAAHVRRITEADAPRCFQGSQLWFEATCCGATVAASQKRHCLHHRGLGKRCPATLGEHLRSSPQQALPSLNPCVASAGKANPAWEDVWTGYALSQTAGLGRLYVVHVHLSLLHDLNGFKVSRGAISWHSQVDRDMPRRTAVIHRWIGAHGCSDESIQLSCHEPVASETKPTASMAFTCAGQQQVVCNARRRQTGGDRQQHNCAAQPELLWDLLPPLNVTDAWPTETLAAYAHGHLHVTTEGDLRKGSSKKGSGSHGHAASQHQNVGKR
mmetsp:Transcript_22252/g.45462  ORF Transcript_22252/g.45462 Transcript_22252/m.45462 type:complete len:469 (+) Transcript_22252:103-1509(+)